MKRGWLGITVGCLIIAAFALLLNHTDIAFVAAAAGAISWFLDLRPAMVKIADDNRPKELDVENDVEDSD